MKLKLLLALPLLSLLFALPATAQAKHHKKHHKHDDVAVHRHHHDGYHYERRLHGGRYRYYRDGRYYYRVREGNDWGYRPYARDPGSVSVTF